LIVESKIIKLPMGKHSTLVKNSETDITFDFKNNINDPLTKKYLDSLLAEPSDFIIRNIIQFSQSYRVLGKSNRGIIIN
jgi:hypothetical protein